METTDEPAISRQKGIDPKPNRAVPHNAATAMSSRGLIMIIASIVASNVPYFFLFLINRIPAVPYVF